MAEPIDLTPLCVDLDGTLIRGDLTLISCGLFLKKNPANAALLFLWFLRGRAFLKSRLAERIEPDWSALPYRRSVVDWLSQERSRGRRLILISGTPARYAQAAAKRLGFFSESIGSDERTNLIGKNKARRLIDRFGIRNYDYVGDCWADLPVFAAARRGFLIAKSSRLVKAVGRRTDLAMVFKD
ncbi:MAG: haloacid dehalogenase-like hydrolase [Elusimicrobiota bacterium]